MIQHTVTKIRDDRCSETLIILKEPDLGVGGCHGGIGLTRNGCSSTRAVMESPNYYGIKAEVATCYYSSYKTIHTNIAYIFIFLILSIKKTYRRESD